MTFGFAALLKKLGSCGTRFSQTVLAEILRLFCAARHGKKGLKVKNIEVCHSMLDTESSGVKKVTRFRLSSESRE